MVATTKQPPDVDDRGTGMSDEILAGWEMDLRAIALREMPLVEEAYRETLNKMPISDLMIRYINWRDRLVHPHPRTVCLPPNFKVSQHHLNYQRDLSDLLVKIETGALLTPYLSRRIRYGYDEDHRGRAGANSLDLMLNDWNIHHLHISSEIESDGFVKRTADLLFVVFRQGIAFVLGIYDHSKWAEEEVVRVAISNWPEQRLFEPLRMAVGLEYQTTSEERVRLRAAGVAMMMEIDGAVYMPPGISTSGTSTRASLQWIKISRSLRACAENIGATIARLKAVSDQDGSPFPDQPRVEVVSVCGPTEFGFGLREVQTGRILWLN